MGCRRSRKTTRWLARTAYRDGVHGLSRPAPARHSAARALSRTADRTTPGRLMTIDRTPAPAPDTTSHGDTSILEKRLDRRRALGVLLGGAVVGSQAISACTPLSAETDEAREAKRLAWQEYIKG